MRTQVEEFTVKSREIDNILYKSFNTISNEPELPAFTFDEVVDFLERKGYLIVRAKGIARTEGSRTTDEQEVIRFDTGYQEVQNVFARKQTEKIPLDFSSEEAMAMTIRNVFIKELKHKLLF